MSFATPLGLLGLLAVPAVLALHLFRRRLRPRRIAGVFLFEPKGLTAAAGRRRTRLLRTASLWFELAAATVLGLWLAGFSVGLSEQPLHVVFVVDDSASMAARGEDGRSAADRARDAVMSVVEEMPVDALATVIRTGPRPEILAGPRTLVGTVGESLDRWEPWRPGHDPLPALELGLELARDDGALWFLTDGRDVEAPPAYTVRAFGQPVANVAILSARRRTAPDGEESLFANFAVWGAAQVEAEVSVEVQATAEQRQVARRTVELRPGVPSSVRLTVPASSSPWIVSITAPANGLAADDSCVLLPEPDRTVVMASGLADEVSDRLELERLARALTGVRLVAASEPAHLRFVAQPGPVGAGANEVVIAPLPSAETDPWIGPFLVERRHPLGTGVTLDGVVWTAGRGALPGMPIVFAGQQPLCSEERVGDGVRLHLNLDVTKSNLPASPDWPIFLANTIEHVRRRLPGPVAVNVTVGDLIEWRPGSPDDVAHLTLVDPDGEERAGRGVGTCAWSARQSGVHSLFMRDQEIARYAVRFSDADESDLTSREAFVDESTAAAGDSPSWPATSSRCRLRSAEADPRFPGRRSRTRGTAVW